MQNVSSKLGNTTYLLKIEKFGKKSKVIIRLFYLFFFNLASALVDGEAMQGFRTLNTVILMDKSHKHPPFFHSNDSYISMHEHGTK